MGKVKGINWLSVIVGAVSIALSVNYFSKWAFVQNRSMEDLFDLSNYFTFGAILLAIGLVNCIGARRLKSRVSVVLLSGSSTALLILLLILASKISQWH